MKALTVQDLWPLPVYEQVRDEFRQTVINEKKNRRLSVGPYMTFVFENRLTVKFQIMEILRAERVTDPKVVAEEVDGFNTMLPPPGGLSATLLIELRGDEPSVKAELARLTGLAQHVFLVIDGERVRGVFDQGRDDGQRVSAVQYVRFPVGPLGSKLASAKVELVVDHPNYTHKLEIAEPIRRSLAADLEAA